MEHYITATESTDIGVGDESIYCMGYIEKYESGINKIMKACSIHPFVEVEFYLKSYRTIVVFRKKMKFKFAEVDQRIIGALTEIRSATKYESRSPVPIIYIEYITASHAIDKMIH